MKIKDLSVCFHTDKIEECVNFYTLYLGAKVSFDAEWYVSIRLQSSENQPIFLSFQSASFTKSKAFSGGQTLNVMVDDVDVEYSKLKEKGAKISNEIEDHEWGDRAFAIEDPIGNQVYIYSPRELADKYKSAVKE